ncbi:MAG: hypothetical protein D6689_20355 [Deltaproteobacteria bacterium]|nr:MAG: hypothetical protein D6689_20355 [Deltaproteobacteria bacterium]
MAGTTRHAAARATAGGLVAGAIAGAGAGAIDALWSGAALAQFVPAWADRARAVALAAALYAVAAAVVGAALGAAGWALWRKSYVGTLWRRAAEAHRARRQRDPRAALAPLATAIALVPSAAASLGGTYVATARALALRQHRGLIVAVAMAAAVAALVVAVLVALAVAGAVEAALRRLARAERVARALSAPAAPAIAAIALTATAAAVAAYAAWDTVKLLHLRPVVAVAGTALLGWPAGRAAARIVARLPVRWLAASPVAVAVLGVVAAAAGDADGPRKAVDRYTGLGGPCIRALRRLGDWDRDGYSRILGGGDCDDGDPHVHPGATEIPDDSVDQNCVGGDASIRRSPDDLAFAPRPAGLPDRPNIVLITIDTLRADHVGAYGYPRPTTPALDALAADGALFRNAWAHAPSTRYSVPAILTGRYPLAVDYDYSVWWPALSPRATTIAERLAALGFHTGAILNYRYFDRKRRMDQGFAEYDNENARLHSGRDPAKTTGSSSREQTDKAIAFINRNRFRQFFLWVHYYDPHYTYERHPGTPSFGNRPIDLYDHEIRYTDTHIGRLLDELKATGLYDKTIVVVTGDHGEGFGEHGVDKHGYHLYAAQTRVPLIVRVPGLAPRTIRMPAGHIDIAPTLVNLAGGQPSVDLQGRSLVDVLSGAADPDADRWVFQQLSFENHNEQRAAANQRCHVIYYVSPQNAWELYRIDEDPGETRDAIASPGPCRDARATLEAWYDWSEIPPAAADALLPGPPNIADPLDVRVGDFARLLAVDLPADPVRPGATIDVTYTWQVTAVPDAKWKVFAHFERPGGGRFLGDHAPVRPFAWWRPGQYIRYTIAVTVPDHAPRGDYVLWVGVFRGGERAELGAANPRIRIRDRRAAVGVLHVQ